MTPQTKSCPHGYYLSPPLTQHDTPNPDAMFSVISPECQSCNFYGVRKELQLMRTRNMEYLREQKARLENVNLLKHSETSLQQLRHEVSEDMVALISAWRKKVVGMKRDWEMEWGPQGDLAADGTSVFKAELEALNRVQF